MVTFPVLVVLPKDTDVSSIKSVQKAAKTVLQKYSTYSRNIPAAQQNWKIYTDFDLMAARMNYESDSEYHANMSFEEFLENEVGLTPVPGTSPKQFGVCSNTLGVFGGCDVNTRFDNLLPVKDGGLALREEDHKAGVLRDNVLRLGNERMDLVFNGSATLPTVSAQTSSGGMTMILSQLAKPAIHTAVNSTFQLPTTAEPEVLSLQEKLWNKYASATRLQDLDWDFFKLVQEYMASTCTKDLVERVGFASIRSLMQEEEQKLEGITPDKSENTDENGEPKEVDPLPLYILKYLQIHTSLQMSLIAKDDQGEARFTLSEDEIKEHLRPLFAACFMAIVSEAGVDKPASDDALSLAMWRAEFEDKLKALDPESVVCICEASFADWRKIDSFMFFQQTILEVPEVSAGAFY